MTEASLSYEAASTNLGNDFLDDVQRVIDALCESPSLGPGVVESSMEGQNYAYVKSAQPNLTRE